jgi:hypothetical protein
LPIDVEVAAEAAAECPLMDFAFGQQVERD